MSAEQKIQLAEQGLKDKQFEKVVELTDAAIKSDPFKCKPYIQRSIALQRLGKYRESFDASELAIANGNKLGRRELIADSQFRRGIASYYLKRYADADASFDWAKKYGSKDKSLQLWMDKVENKLTEEETLVVEEIPEVEPEIKEIKEKVKDDKRDVKNDNDNDNDMKEALALKEEYTKQAAAEKKKQAFYEKDKVRFDWYQTKPTINLSIFLKNAPKDKTDIKFENELIKLTTAQPDDTLFKYELALTNPIDPEKSSFRVFGTKIELTLVKKEQGNWKELVKTETEATTTTTTTKNNTSLDEMRTALNEPKLPSFHGNDLEKAAEEELKEIEKNEQEHGDLFQSLFKDADDDTKRAMMKSYIESQGTALSTSWDDVKDKKYEVDPPTGMEAKYY